MKTLSDNIIGDEISRIFKCDFIRVEHIKQFIKEIIKLRDWYINNSLDHNHEEDCIICQIIDDLQVLLDKAGNKLIEEKEE